MDSIANEIAKFYELKEKGVLTEEEFEVQKQLLLSKAAIVTVAVPIEERVSEEEEIEEEVFFEGGGFKVTTSTFQTPSTQTYAVSDITLVKVKSYQPSDGKNMLISLLFAFMAAYYHNSHIPMSDIAAGVVAVVGLLFIASIRRKCYLVLTSSSNFKHTVLVDNDEEVVKKIAVALNESIAYRDSVA